jgi:hypothetical protein
MLLTLTPWSTREVEVIPCVDAEALLGRAMHSAINLRDAEQVQRLLASADDVSTAVAIRALWLPIVEMLGHDGVAFDGDGQLSHLVRKQIRAALLLEDDVPISRWLVPVTLADTTAAYLTALVLSRCGMGTRVWPWLLPAPGRLLMVGDSEAALLQHQSRHERIPIHGETLNWPPLAALVA